MTRCHTAVCDRIGTFARRVKAQSLNVHGSQWQTKGWPDVIVWWKLFPHYCAGFEVKWKEDELSKIQHQRACRLMLNKTPVVVVRAVTVSAPWKVQRVVPDNRKARETLAIVANAQELFKFIRTWDEILETSEGN